MTAPMAARYTFAPLPCGCGAPVSVLEMMCAPCFTAAHRGGCQWCGPAVGLCHCQAMRLSAATRQVEYEALRARAVDAGGKVCQCGYIAEVMVDGVPLCDSCLADQRCAIGETIGETIGMGGVAAHAAATSRMWSW